MRDYWTIFNLTEKSKELFSSDEEMIAIMECDTEMTESEERRIVTSQLGNNWGWGNPISEAEFGTYQAFGIKEVKL